MQSFLKKTSFVAAGLGIIGASLFFGNLDGAHAAVKEGQKFEDWVANCTVDDKNKSICLISQQVSTTPKGDEKPQLVSMYQFGYFTQGKEKKLKSIITVGANINVPAGTAFIISAKDPKNNKVLGYGKFISCSQGFCQSVAEISEDDLSAMLKSSVTYVGILNVEGKQVNFPFSSKGLKEGLAVLK